jgi:CHAD domain-containing protein
MARNGKWIDSRADDAVQTVARSALEARLKRMWHYLELAVRESPSETENVHQLRVFSRRAAAAMEMFDAWLPPRRGRWMRKQVKQVRKAAGEARDLDVLRMRWTAIGQDLPPDRAVVLLEHVEHRRLAAQRPIEEIYARLLGKRFLRRTSKFLRRVRKSGGEGPSATRFGCLAQRALGQLVGPYLAAAQVPLIDVNALHAFRIQGKRVRYAMEIFAGAFDAPFRHELYPVVAALQDRLGAINDHVVAQAYLVRWREVAESCAIRQALEIGTQHEQQALDASRQEFLAWWTPQRQEDLRRHFARYVQLESPDDQPPRNDDRGC